MQILVGAQSIMVFTDDERVSDSARAGRVQSVERAIALLRAIAVSPGGRATAPELAARCDLNRATTWRVLKTLQAHGMVVSTPGSTEYGIGPTAVEIGAAGQDSLIQVARGPLEETCKASGETATLAVVGPAGLAYVDEVSAPTLLSVSWEGRRAPVHATSAGKALLAWLPEPAVQSLVAEGLTRYTDTTITSVEDLVADLAASRARGYAICRGELEQGLYGVSAPILDLRGDPVAVLSLWGPRSRVEDRIEALGAIVKDAAASVEHARLAGWQSSEGA